MAMGENIVLHKNILNTKEQRLYRFPSKLTRYI